MVDHSESQNDEVKLAEVKRSFNRKALAQPPQQSFDPTMVVSLEQPLTVEAPIEVEPTEPADSPVAP